VHTLFNKYNAPLHDVQSSLSAPLQVAQVASHAWQTLLSSAYLPSGQLLLQVLPSKTKGSLLDFELAQVRQLSFNPPLHVAQVA